MSSTHMGTLLNHRGKVDRWGRDKETMEEHDRLRQILNEEARENWRSEEWHRQVAADIASMLDYEFTFNSPFGDWLDVQRVGEFDRVRIRERRGLKVFYTSRGGYIEESQLRTEDWELPRDTLGFHVSEHEDKLRADFATSMEDLVSLGSSRQNAEVNRRIFNLLQEAVPTGSSYIIETATLSQSDLNDAVRDVKDSVQPNGQGPVPITIVGRATAVDQISDFSGYSEEAQEEIRLRGRLGIYRGANIQQLINYTDEDGDSYVPHNEVWVMGGTAGKFALYGGQIAKTWEENTVDYRHYRTRQDIGGIVHHPEQVRRFVLSGI